MTKTIIQIYKQEIKGNNRDHDVTMSGLGDCIRGTLTLYKLSKIYGFNLIIDFRYHPIGKYIDTQNIEYTNFIESNMDELKFFFFIDGLKNYILNNDNNIICVQTNAFYEEEDIYDTNVVNSLKEDEQNFMKNIFKPNNKLYNIIQLKINNLPNNYNIIHFRLGDNKLIHNNNISDDELIKYENIFNKYYENNDILITDNSFFKNYMKLKYNINTLDTEIGHLGNTTDINSIEGTLVDFFVQSNSNIIKTYSIYCWISGFIHWNAKIYNIPIKKIED
jgi:hypothetical protein